MKIILFLISLTLINYQIYCNKHFEDQKFNRIVHSEEEKISPLKSITSRSLVTNSYRFNSDFHQESNDTHPRRKRQISLPSRVTDQNNDRKIPTTERKVLKKPTATTTATPRESFQCGEGLKSKSTTSFILKGKTAQKNDFPWLVALFMKSIGFTCQGSLVSHKIVVTAAHCIRDKRSATKIKENESTYYLGKHKLNDFTERDFVASGVNKFIVHSDWNAFEDQYKADIAIAILSKNIIFQRNIQPICIHESRQNHHDLIGFQGYVAGWGLTEDRQISEVPHYIKVPVVSDEECLESNEFFSRIKSSTHFCVGDRSGSNPCSGDDGGGFFVKYENKFYLRGIVSAGLQEEYGECSKTDYVLVTDVNQYADWINNFIEFYG